VVAVSVSFRSHWPLPVHYHCRRLFPVSCFIPCIA